LSCFEVSLGAGIRILNNRSEASKSPTNIACAGKPCMDCPGIAVKFTCVDAVARMKTSGGWKIRPDFDAEITSGAGLDWHT